MRPEQSDNNEPLGTTTCPASENCVNRHMHLTEKGSKSDTPANLYISLCYLSMLLFEGF